MNEFKKKMLRLFLTHPLDYNIYLDGFGNKDYGYRVIQSFIPTDTGIEMEIGPQMVSVIESVKNNHPKAFYRTVIDSTFEINFRIEKKHHKYCIMELERLYNMMRKPYMQSKRSDNCGIHIHTNLMTSFEVRSLLNNSDIDRVVKRIERHFKYEGTYNASKFSTHKGNSVIYRMEYRTIEYRCIPMTWSFKELLKHIIYCHAMTKAFQMYSKGQCDINRVKMIANEWHDILLDI